MAATHFRSVFRWRFSAVCAVLLLAGVASAEGPTMQERIDVGEFNLRAGRWREARDILEPLSKEPGAPAAVFRGLGEAYINLGQRDRAIASYERAIHTDGDELARLQLIDLLGQNQNNAGWDRAIELLQEYLSRHPDDFARRRRLGELLVYKGRIEEAVPQLERVLASNPDDAPTQLLHARTLSWSNRHSEANAAYRRAIAGGAVLNDEDQKWRARAEEAVGDQQNALQHYGDYLRIKPGNAEALAGRARMAISLGRDDDAADSIERLRGQLASDPELDIDVARLEVRRNRREAALPLYEAALARDPHPRRAQEYADILASLGRGSEAIAVLEKYDPDRVGDPAGRLRILTAAPERRAEAIALAERLTQQPGASEDVWRSARQLVVTAKGGTAPKALAQRVARHYPKDGAARRVAGVAKPQAGEPALRSKVERSPKDARGFAALAGAQLRAGKLDEARATVESAGDLVDGSSELLNVRAGIAFAGGDLDSAQRDYQAALALAPSSVTAKTSLIEIALAQSDYERAERLLAAKPTIAKHDAARFREQLALHRQLALLDTDPDAARGAEPALRQGLARDPGRSDYRLRLAQLLERTGRGDEALREYQQLQTAQPPLREAYLAPTRIYTERGDHDAALAAFEEFERRFPGEENVGRARLLANRAEASKRAGDYSTALATYRQALELAPADVELRNGLAGVYFAAGQLEDAAAAYADAAAIDPTNSVARRGQADARAALAGAAVSRGDTARALQIYEHQLATDPGNVEAQRGRAAVFASIAGQSMAAGNLADAERYADQVLAIDPGHRDAVQMKMQIVGGRQEWNEARRIAAAVPDRSWSRQLLEWVDVESGLAQWRQEPSALSPTAALALIDRGLRSDPSRTDLLFDRARALEMSGDARGALAAYRKASAAPNAPADAIAGEVRSLTALKRYEEAERALDRMAQLPPEAQNRERAGLRRARATALKDIGQTEEAFIAAREALALNPNDPDSLSLLGGIYLAANQPADAIAPYRQALALRPNDPGTLQGLAGAYEGIGDWQSAESVYADLASIPGGSFPAEAQRRIALRRDLATSQALIEAGRAAEAQQLLENVRQREPRNPEVWASLSEVTLRAGKKTLAQTYAEQGLALDPKSERLQAARIRALAQQGRYQDAEDALSTAATRLPPDQLATIRQEVRRARRDAEREQLMREGRLDLAYLRLAEEYQANPSDPDVLKAIGYLFLQTRQYQEANHFFATAQSIVPDDSEARMGSAYALRGLGDSRAALRQIESVHRANPTADTALALAEMYHDLGRSSDASRMLAQARELSGDRGLALPALRTEGAAPARAYTRYQSESVLPALQLPSGPVRAVPGVPESKASGARRPRRPEFASTTARTRTHAPGLRRRSTFCSAGGDFLRPAKSDESSDGLLAQRLPSYDRVMEDVRGGQAPVEQPTPKIIYRDNRPFVDERYEQDGIEYHYRRRVPTVPEESVGEAPLPRDRAGQPLRLERDVPEPEGVPDGEPRIAPAQRRRAVTPLDSEARARAYALERKLAAERLIKISVGFRYDFLDSVSDVRANEFAMWRFPVFVETPAFLNGRFRLTGEPVVLDNGLVTDAGFGAEAALRGLTLGTDILKLSGGIGMTPVGFPKGPDLTGFARLEIDVGAGTSITPFFERRPVIESLLSYRGNHYETATDDVFFGKVMENRYGGNLGFRTPQEITGSLEVAYSTLDGVNTRRNEKLDGFFGIGRDFVVACCDYVLRPGAQVYYMHYKRDLSEAVPQSVAAADPLLEDGAGYFSPDSFLEGMLRLDFRGPLFPGTFPDGSRFLIGGRGGAQWVSGVEASRFRGAEGTRGSFGGDGLISVPLGEVAVFTVEGGFTIADPYDRAYFGASLLFPL